MHIVECPPTHGGAWLFVSKNSPLWCVQSAIGKPQLFSQKSVVQPPSFGTCGGFKDISWCAPCESLIHGGKKAAAWCVLFSLMCTWSCLSQWIASSCCVIVSLNESLKLPLLDADYVHMQCHGVAAPFWNQICNPHFPRCMLKVHFENFFFFLLAFRTTSMCFFYSNWQSSHLRSPPLSGFYASSTRKIFF